MRSLELALHHLQPYLCMRHVLRMQHFGYLQTALKALVGCCHT